MIIKKANNSDDIVLTEITNESKAFWGYSQQQMLLWSDDLKITRKYIENNNVFKLVHDDMIIGYYSFIKEQHHSIRLDNLFILPAYINRGCGSPLMNDF